MLHFMNGISYVDMNHVFFGPKPYNKLYAQEEDKKIILQLSTDLSPEEEKTEFSQYFHLGPVPADKVTLESLKGDAQLGKEDMFYPEQYIEKMVKTGYTEAENGYGILEEGVAYGAAMTLQKGVNDENMLYFNENFANGPGDIFYKTWSPGIHRRLYPDLSLEDMGWGPVEIRVTGFFSAQDMGLPVNLEEIDPEFIDFNAMNVEVLPLGAPEGTVPVHRLDMSYFRQTEDGREIRYRTWIGMSFENGKIVRYPVKDAEKLKEYVTKTVSHVGSEATTAARNITLFYKNHH